MPCFQYNDEDGQYVFWHSSAHILGEAMEVMNEFFSRQLP